MKLPASLLNLLRSFLKGERAFAKLSQAPLRRLLLIEALALAVFVSGHYFLRYRHAVSSALDSCRQLQRETELAAATSAQNAAFCESLIQLQQKVTDWIALSGRTANAQRFFAQDTSSSGTDFISILPFPRQSVGDYYRRTIRVNLTSDYVELVKYLRSIENENPEFNIIGLDVFSSESIYPRTNVSMLVESYGIEALGEGSTGEKKQTSLEKRNREAI